MRTPFVHLWQTSKQITLKIAVLLLATLAIFFTSDAIAPQTAAAYPFWAQETAPETPREATGRLACANCHLGEKPVEIELPQSVTPDTVFEAVVSIPYDLDSQQVLGDGSKGGLNVGAVLMLPEGFTIAPPERLSEELQEKVSGLYFQPYREDQDNVYIIGPLPGDQYQELTFPILSPDPKTNKDVHFGKFPIHLGGNRGRGQVYPAGNKSNNNVFTASAAGTITAIGQPDGFNYNVTIQTPEGESVVDEFPPGPELIVSEGQEVAAGEALTSDPNVGGFGQEDAEIVLQDPVRIGWLLLFFAAIALSQTFLVLKKKQIERVQAAEIEF
ncbi:MAG: cytochrome f [Spirulina sp.]